MRASWAVPVTGRPAMMAVAMRRVILAEAGDHRGQLAVAGAVDEIGGAHPRKAHAHIQRPVLAEGKSALRLVELEGRHAQIQHDAINSSGIGIRELIHLRKLALHQGQAAAETLHQRLAARDGGGIAVDAQHAAIGGFEDGGGIAAAAEGAVDILPAVARLQHLQHFVQHDRKMAARDAGHRASPPRSFSMRAFTRASASASMGA